MTEPAPKRMSEARLAETGADELHRRLSDVLPEYSVDLLAHVTARLRKLDRIETMAATGTAENFLATDDETKRLYFALGVEESARRKKLEAAGVEPETAKFVLGLRQLATATGEFDATAEQAYTQAADMIEGMSRVLTNTFAELTATRSDAAGARAGAIMDIKEQVLALSAPADSECEYSDGFSDALYDVRDIIARALATKTDGA